MRKLFVLFLLVALVPFTVGCNGLWDFEDDSDPVATTTLSAKATLPSAAFSANGSIRAAASYTGLTMRVGGNVLTATSAVDNGDGTMTVTFTKVVTVAQAAAVTGNVVAEILSGTTVIVTTTVALGTTAAPTVTVVVTGTVVAGVFTPTAVTVTYVTATVTTPVTVVTTGTTFLPVTNPVFNVTGVTYGTTALTMLNDTNTVTVSTLNPTFRVNFSEAPVLTAATWEVMVTNVTSGAAFTLTSTTYPTLFTTTAVGTAVDVKVAGATGKALVAGKTYKVALKATNVKNAAGTLLDGIAAFYFKTAATTVTTTSLSSVTPTTLGTTTGQVLTLNFSAAVKSAPETGATVSVVKTGGSTVALTSASTDITIAQGTDTTKATITINKALTAGTYTVSVSSGLWLDMNGNQIEGTTQTFTVQ